MNHVDTEKQERVLDAFRRWGYLQANLDPLGHFAPYHHPELDLSGADADAARRIYSGSIGVEFMHIPDPERREWIQERMESADEYPIDRTRVLDQLVHADIFEQTIHSRYIGTKRYSLEGNTALIPLLDEILNSASDNGADQAVLAMSHRGRLNVIINIVSRPAAEIFAGFEDVDPRSVLGGGDVKYHIGATGMFTGASGRQVRIHLVSNPSHLEAVDPVALGRARAKQTRIGRDGKVKVLPVMMHGDSAFAGQGITAETLNLANLRGLYGRWHGAHHRQQPHRIHDQSRGRLLGTILLRSRQAPADSHLPRQWRRRRRGRAGRSHGARISLRVWQ